MTVRILNCDVLEGLRQLADDERAARIVAIERTNGSHHSLIEPRGDSTLQAGDSVIPRAPCARVPYGDRIDAAGIDG